MPNILDAHADKEKNAQQTGSYPPGWPKHEDGLTGTPDDYDTDE